MLGKLLKYEFKATARQMLPLYAITMIVGLFFGMSVRSDFLFYNSAQGVSTVTGVLLTVMTILISSVFFMTFILGIRRFYNNIFKQEGYLTMTLPVHSWQILLSKISTPLFWFLLSAVVVLLTTMLMGFGALGFEFFEEFSLKVIISEIDSSLRSILKVSLKDYFGWSLLEFFTGFLYVTMSIYFSIAIGQLPLFAKKRTMWAIVFFFTIQVIVWNVIMDSITRNVYDKSYSLPKANLTMLQYSCVVYFVLFIVFFVCTNYIMRNKLNLEN